MERKFLTRTLKAFITLAMLQTPFGFEVEAKAVAGGSCSYVDKCKKAVSSATAQANASTLMATQKSTGGVSGGGGALQDASNGTASAACTAQQQCDGFAEKCSGDKSCKEDQCKQIKEAAASAGAQCQQALGAAGGAGNTKSAASGGGDAGAMLGALAPVAMMAALMAMQNKKKKDDDKPKIDPNSAWNGVQLDCAKPDAHLFQACNGQMENKCAAQMDEPTCVMFESRYCVGDTGQGPNGNVAPPVIAGMPQVDPATGIVMGGVPVMGGPSEGVGTTFCQNYTAYNFCKGAGRTGCPSCARLRDNASAICAQNPAACVAANSQAVMADAAKTCPTDPAFANPNWNTPTQTGGVPSTMAAGGGGATILPQSVNGNSGNPVVAGGSANGGALNGAIPASASGNGTGAMQEGRATGSVPGAAGYNGSSGSNGSTGGTFGTPGREVASSTTNFRPSSLNGAPAPDVQARNSPNLFLTGSLIIKNRCDTGRLNCP